MYGTTGVSSMLISDQHQAAVPDGLVCYLLTPANATAQDQSCLFTSRQGQALRYFASISVSMLHGSSSQNHRMCWVGKDLKDHSVPTSLLFAGTKAYQPLDKTPSGQGCWARLPHQLPQRRGHGAHGLRQHLSFGLRG